MFLFFGGRTLEMIWDFPTEDFQLGNEGLLATTFLPKLKWCGWPKNCLKKHIAHVPVRSLSTWFHNAEVQWVRFVLWQLTLNLLLILLSADGQMYSWKPNLSWFNFPFIQNLQIGLKKIRKYMLYSTLRFKKYSTDIIICKNSFRLIKYKNMKNHF